VNYYCSKSYMYNMYIKDDVLVQVSEFLPEVRSRDISRNLNFGGGAFLDKCLGGSVNMCNVHIYTKKH